MTHRIAAGTPVTVDNPYGLHYGNSDNLVVLKDQGTGYGVGFKGNEPAKYHDDEKGWLYYSDGTVTPKEESKTVTKFNKGDKVEILDDYMCAKKGDTLTVDTSGSGHTYATHDATGEWIGGYTSRFKLVEPPFTYKDIQEGDTIRRTLTLKGGAKEVREGTVGHVKSWYVANAEDTYILAYDSDDTHEGVTLELLSRPEPEPEPTLLEKTKKGDKLVVSLSSGVQKVYTKATGDSWTTLVLTGDGKAHKGFSWETEELEEQVSRSAVLSYTLIPA